MGNRSGPGPTGDSRSRWLWLAGPGVVLQALCDQARKVLRRWTWPTSLDEAVERIVAGLSEQDKAKLRAIPDPRGLSKFHHGWGAGIRNRFGMWRGNHALLRSCGTSDPDYASAVVLEEVWRRVRDSS